MGMKKGLAFGMLAMAAAMGGDGLPQDRLNSVDVNGDFSRANHSNLNRKGKRKKPVSMGNRPKSKRKKGTPRA